MVDPYVLAKGGYFKRDSERVGKNIGSVDPYTPIQPMIDYRSLQDSISDYLSPTGVFSTRGFDSDKNAIKTFTEMAKGPKYPWEELTDVIKDPPSEAPPPPSPSEAPPPPPPRTSTPPDIGVGSTLSGPAYSPIPIPDLNVELTGEQLAALLTEAMQYSDLATMGGFAELDAMGLQNILGAEKSRETANPTYWSAMRDVTQNASNAVTGWMQDMNMMGRLGETGQGTVGQGAGDILSQGVAGVSELEKQLSKRLDDIDTEEKETSDEIGVFKLNLEKEKGLMQAVELNRLKKEAIDREITTRQMTFENRIASATDQRDYQKLALAYDEFNRDTDIMYKNLALEERKLAGELSSIQAQIAQYGITNERLTAQQRIDEEQWNTDFEEQQRQRAFEEGRLKDEDDWQRKIDQKKLNQADAELAQRKADLEYQLEEQKMERIDRRLLEIKSRSEREGWTPEEITAAIEEVYASEGETIPQRPDLSTDPNVVQYNLNDPATWRHADLWWHFLWVSSGVYPGQLKTYPGDEEYRAYLQEHPEKINPVALSR